MEFGKMVGVAAVATAVLSVSAVAFPVRQATAAEESSPDARVQYRNAKTHYQLGEYADALKDFKEAYRLKQDPVLLFNIAQCYRQLGDYANAFKLYQSYLRDSPEAPNRDEVERLLSDIKKALDQTPPSANNPAPAAPDSNPPDTYPIPPVVAAPPPNAATNKPPVTELPIGTQPFAMAPVASIRPEAELEITATEADASISVNQSVISSDGHAKLKLPPGLYNIAVSKDEYRSAGGVLVLMAGDRQSLIGKIEPLKTHGWRKTGIWMLVFGALGETAGQIGHHEANRRFQGSDQFKGFSGLEKIGHGIAITGAVLGILSITLDILKNGDRVEPGPPTMLMPNPATPAATGAVP